jgi:hypothetical protein
MVIRVFGAESVDRPVGGIELAEGSARDVGPGDRLTLDTTEA